MMSVSHESKPISPTKLTYDDLALFPDDGKRHEIMGGRHYMNASPVPNHQIVSTRILLPLVRAIDAGHLGTVIPAPVDVQFSEHDVVVPDIIIVLTENRIITPFRVEGAPDLIVEILSPSTKKNDEQLKKQLYQQHGVPEYWIVDPDDKVVHQFLLNDERIYGESVRCTDKVTFQGVAGGVTVDLTQVWPSEAVRNGK